MEKTVKFTKKDKFNEIIRFLSGDCGECKNGLTVQDLIDFCENELDLLNKKSSSKKLSEKEIAKKNENEELKAVILEVLTNNGSCSISEMKAKDTTLFPLSSSKISALLVQLRADGLIVRNYEKKVAIFSLA